MTSFLGSRHFGFCHSLTPTRVPCRLSSAQAPARRGLTVHAAKPFGPGKKWEHLETNKNGKVVRTPIHVRKGDTVQVIAGRDKGKVGEIKEVLLKLGKVVVEGVNIKTKTVQPKSKDESGQLVQTESPVHHSNVMLYSTAQKVRSRIGHKFLDDGRKVRYLKKTGEVLEDAPPKR